MLIRSTNVALAGNGLGLVAEGEFEKLLRN
jgi:hypothetical protein